MKLHPVLFALAFASVSILPAQTSAPPAKKTNAAPPIVSPEILPDGRVTFRLRAPNAKAVSVSGQFQKGSAPMTKDDAGLWSVTVGPVAPDIYEYSFTVDGLAMIDSANRDIKPMRNPRTSILEIPGNPPLLHDFQNVPHGRVSLHWYASKSLGRRRPMQVYTPPDYEKNPGARFPVLYLFHGSGDNESTWVAHGHAHWIMDNLIAQGSTVQMIVVMLDGHAVPPGVRGAPTARNANITAFERDLLEDVMPLVAASYRTKENAASRAIIGLSMGGGQSLTIGLTHPDLFAWVGGMSSAIGDPAALIGDGAALNRQLKLLWFACGKDDQLMKANHDLDAALTAANVKHEFVETDGAHAWPVWRKHLASFVPKLFPGPVPPE